MQDVHEIIKDGSDFILNTGSPHYVTMNSDHSTETVVDLGKSIRYSEKFIQDGINVNLLSVENDGIRVATYERGVEDETLSCGTGVTACALVYAKNFPDAGSHVRVSTKGGKLEVFWERSQHGFEQIYLVGPATFVYKGKIERC
jgi:diaminopimelate epimerase